MKKLLIAALLVVSTLLASCAGGDSNVTTTTKKPTNQPEEVKLASTYATLREDRAASLTVDADKAELVLISGEKTQKFSGAISYTDNELTVGENKFPFSLFANYIVIESEGVTYMLEPVDKTDYNYLGVNMMSSNWTGDNISLTFEGFKCTYTKDGVTITNNVIVSEGFIKLESPNTNIAIGATATDSANEGGMSPDLAIDGDVGSRWGSVREDNQYIIVDLGSAKDISTVRIYWETASGCNFNIETSLDGETWTVVDEVVDNTVQNDYTVHEFESTKAQFVKMNGFTRTTKYGFSIWEFEIYEAFTDGFDASYEVVDGNLQLKFGGQTYTLTPAK